MKNPFILYPLYSFAVPVKSIRKYRILIGERLKYSGFECLESRQFLAIDEPYGEVRA